MKRLRAFLSLGLGSVASIIGIGSGINSLTGGGLTGGSGTGGTAYRPTGQPQADTNWQAIISSLLNSGNQQASTIAPGIARGYAAGQPGGQFGNLPTDFSNYAGGLVNQAQQQQRNAGVLQDAGVQAWLTSLDPQNALRNQLQQQVTDASRAGTSARGIGMSGNAAGIENQDVSNFLMQWQNQQLGRQLAGLQGLGGAMNSAAGQFRGVGQDYTGAAGLQNTGALFPFQMANAYTGAAQGGNQQLAGLSPQILGYLGYGQQAGNNAFTQGQVGLNNLTSGLGQLGSIFNQTQPAAPISDIGTQYGGP